MSEGRWQPEAVAEIAAKYRGVARRHSWIKVPPLDVVTLCDKIAEVMREANALADENDNLKAQLAQGQAPKFAPFAPRRRT